MKTLNTENLVQIITAIAVVIGLGLVVWELQQAKSLAFTQIVHGDMDGANQMLTSIYGEDLSRVLATACFKPTELDQPSGFVLDAYFDYQLMLIQRIRVQVNIAGFDSPWQIHAQRGIKEIISFPQGSRWLSDEDWYRKDPEFAEEIALALKSDTEPCNVKIGKILAADQ